MTDTQRANAEKEVERAVAPLPDRPLFWRVFRSRLADTPLAQIFRRGRRNARTDVYLISFPCCGRTWLRLLIGRLFMQRWGEEDEKMVLELRKMARKHPGMPRIKVFHDDDPHHGTPEELMRNKGEFRDRKVIFLVRDPRDLLVSLYFQITKRERAFSGTISEFLRRRRGSLASLLAFLKVWDRAKEIPEDFLLVRYEDLHKDAAGELKRVSEFLEMDQVTEAMIAESVAFASFRNMKKMETTDELDNWRMRAVDESDPESSKMRKGEVGGYADYLSPEDVSYVEKQMSTLLPPLFGYEPCVNPQSR